MFDLTELLLITSLLIVPSGVFLVIESKAITHVRCVLAAGSQSFVLRDRCTKEKHTGLIMVIEIANE
jgi:hypothetical protein